MHTRKASDLSFLAQGTVWVTNVLERTHRDIHGPTHLPCEPFYYFMGVKDASSRFSHIRLLSTRNMACLDSSLSSSWVLNSQIFQLSRFGWTTLPSLRQQPLFSIANLSLLILKFQLLMLTLKMVWLNLRLNKSK